AIAANGGRGTAEHQARAAACEQIVIELAAADTVAHRTGVFGRDDVIRPDRPNAESSDRLKRSTLAVRINIQLQIAHDLRRDPSRTHLVAWEHRSVEDDDVEACATEKPRAGRSGRTTTNDRDVAENHRCSACIW